MATYPRVDLVHPRRPRAPHLVRALAGTALLLGGTATSTPILLGIGAGLAGWGLVGLLRAMLVR